MRILVVQTTRLGDMIQTGPLISQVRAQHPEAHIAVLSRGLAKTVAERHPDVDEVVLYDENQMFLDMRSGDSARLLRAYNEAESVIGTLREKRFDLAYNMTHSVASAILLTLAEIPEVVGAHLSEDWRFVLRGPWTTYFFTSVFSRDYNDLNLCDITRSFAREAPSRRCLSFTVEEEEEAAVDALLAGHGIGQDDFLVCLQLGASEQNKRWAENRFAELALLLREQYDARIVLVGVPEEAAYGEAFEREAPGIGVHLFGGTTVPQLAALLGRARLLVTNDTGTMHLAAAKGCPIVVVSVGHVHFRETGPYVEGAIAIEARRRTLGRSDYVPGGAEERDRITATQALACVRLALDGNGAGSPPVLEDGAALAGVDIYRSRFAADGCLQFQPVIRRGLSRRDLVRLAYRAMWLDHLAAEPAGPETEAAALRDALAAFETPSPGLVEEFLRPVLDALDGLVSLAGRGAEETGQLQALLGRRGAMGEAKTLVGRLMALDEETRVFGEVHPELRPLVLLARFERENLEGADPVTLADTTRAIYGDLQARATLLKSKVATLVRLLA